MSAANFVISAGAEGANGATAPNPLSLQGFPGSPPTNSAIGANWSQGATGPQPAPLAPTARSTTSSDNQSEFSRYNKRLDCLAPAAPLAPEAHIENLTQRLATCRSCCDMLDALEHAAREAGMIEMRAPTISLRLAVATDGWSMAARRIELRRFFWAWMSRGKEAALAELGRTPLQLE